MVRVVAGEGDPAIGRYVIGAEIASGGMATVHLGRIVGAGGFARIVAIKRLHDRYARDPEFVSMFLDEARLAARAPHPNVVPALDVVASEGQLLLVMEYVRGESVAQLWRAAAEAGEQVPVGIAIGVISGVLSGLHAAHEAKSEVGEPLGIVHRDVSPQNILVGVDGVPRVLDFGIAKAKFRLHSTKDGRLKGKLRYMAPEQLRRDDVDRRTDVYAASVVLWELLTGRSLFEEDKPGALVDRIVGGDIVAPGSLRPALPDALDRIVLRGLAGRPEDRFTTALEMAEALEGVGVAATSREIGAWVLERARRTLEDHAAKIRALEGSDRVSSNATRSSPGSDLETQIVADEIARPGLLFGAHDEDIERPAAPTPALKRAIRRRHRRVVLGVVAMVAGIALTTRVLMTSSERSSAVSSAATPIEPPASGATSASASPSTSGSEPPVATASSPPNAGARATERGLAPRRHPRAGKPARTGCDPPYFIDSDGHKQYHPKCL